MASQNLRSAQLTAARRRAGMSQRALGKKIGLAQSHISKLERGAVDLQTSTLAEIAVGVFSVTAINASIRTVKAV